MCVFCQECVWGQACDVAQDWRSVVGFMLRVQYTRAINSIPIDQITGDWIIRESDAHYFEDH